MAETPDSNRIVVTWVQPGTSAARFPVLARYYAEPFEQSPAGDYDYDWIEYDEESDTYSCPAGWYEEAAEYGDDCAPCVRIPDDDVVGWCEAPRMTERRRAVWVPVDGNGHAIEYLARGNPRIAEAALLADRRSAGDERSAGDYRIVPAMLTWSDDV